MDAPAMVICFISIHALREEGDARCWPSGFLRRISIHALREEGDHRPEHCSANRTNFYPRPPRGGRQIALRDFVVPLVISIHALREEGDALPFRAYVMIWQISIHALREEGDRATSSHGLQLGNFYPRPPRGGRQNCAPRLCRPSRYFYPRPPRGGRRAQRDVYKELCIFLSTPSARRATPHQAEMQNHRGISIHALREEGDALCPAAS